MTLGELRKILDVYKEHENVPVFFSSECEGKWPNDKSTMHVHTDEQIYIVQCPIAGIESLSISLLK